MRKLKSNLGLIAFVLTAFAATSFLFISSFSSQAQRKTGDDVAISWTPTKRKIKSVDSKFVLNLPDSVSSQNWVVGVIPISKDEGETIVSGVVSWKDGKMGQKAVIESVNDLSAESFALVNGRVNFSDSNEYNSESGKSFLVLLKVKPETEITVLQKGENLVSKTFSNESGILSQTDQPGMAATGIRRITGVSSLLGELQTRKLYQRFGRKN